MPDFLSMLHFTHPFILAGLLAVPLLWWLLRVMPPKAHRVYLPTAFLLRGLSPSEQTAAKTPWWIILLRMLLLILVILSFADPVNGKGFSFGNKKETVLVVVDNGWSSAAHWAERMQSVQKLLSSTAADQNNFIVMPTTAALGYSDIDSTGLLSLEQALGEIKRMKPNAWPADYSAALKELSTIKNNTAFQHVLFVSDGTSQRDMPPLMQELSQSAKLTVMAGNNVNQPVILRRDRDDKTGFSFTVQSLPDQAEHVYQLQALAADGALLDQQPVTVKKGEGEIQVNLPTEIAGQAFVFRIQSPEMASAIYMLGKAETMVPAGIIADTGREKDKSFLNDVYYLRRALETDHDLTFAPLPALLAKNLSVIIWPDSASLTEGENQSLTEWVEKGGLLIRFAGPNLASKSADDSLLPVEVRSGERVMQGTLTGDQPLGLQDAPKESPFADMPVPKDVKVTHQILAVPTPDVFEKTWLSLEDGSPLVTGGKRERGMIVLVHTSAGPAWSDFCYSGFYVEMLQRLIARGQAIGTFRPEGGDLRPQSMLDAFGRLQPVHADAHLKSVGAASDFYPSSQLPPGFYGRDGMTAAFNLGDALLSIQPLESLPQGSRTLSFDEDKSYSFKVPLLKLAVILFLIDCLVMMALTGLFRRKQVAAIVFALWLMPSAAHAEQIDPADLSSGIYLGYIETGDQRIDQLSYNGLNGLAEVLNQRTMAKVKGVAAVDPASDDLSFYPVLYWPMTPLQPVLSLSAVQALQNYIREGGMIVIDTRDGNYSTGIAQSSGNANLRRLTADLAIPALMQIGEGHILTRSFYLTTQFPGAAESGKVWVEKSPSASNDSVTSLVIGGNEWAAAWSMDDKDRKTFPVMPGGERQREMAYRFGVNIVMAALTGNYKLDQIHSAEILKKLQR